MKTKAAFLLAMAPVLHAGTPEPAPVVTEAPAEYWITPSINIRARYEYGDMDGKDVSHALTFRERVGLKTMAWNGFSAFVEGEFSQAAVRDYNGGAVGATPLDPANTTIADPQTNELNQAFLQYSGYDSTLKGGRQRIIYNNAAFIGNVGWRQNEQTFDAISLENSWIEGLTFKYAYLNQVNRIFGSDATAANQSYVMSSSNLFNMSYSGIENVTLGGYAYVMDFDENPGWDNNSFGLIASGSAVGLDLYGEFAWQDKAGAASNSNAFYGHGTVSKTFFENQKLTLGVEGLGAGFKTPLATVHKFNGFADVFIGGRIGGGHNGLTDCYASYTLPICWGINWTNVLHAFGDNTVDAGYGWEYDSVLSKKFDEHFLAIAKVSHFESEGDVFSSATGAGAVPTTTRFSVELNYTF